MIGITVAVQIPVVQTTLVNFITKQLEAKLKTTVSIQGVNIRFFKTVELNGIYIEDQNKDTLLFATKLSANISVFSLQKQQVIISSIELDRARIGMKKLKATNSMNFDFIVDAFASSDTTTSKSPWNVQFQSIKLIDNTFSYIDERYTEVTRCIDFENVLLNHLNLEVNKFEFYNDSTLINIANISFHEKSGFVVDHLGAEAMFTDSLMRFRNLEIKTPQSDIKGHYRMEFNSMDDFDDYIAKVTMRAEFKESKVSSNDIQYFAEDLFGLDKTITISGVARGTVDHLKVKNLKIGLGKVTKFQGNVVMNGLPDIDNTYFDIIVDELVSDKTDIETIPSFPFDENKKIVLPDNFALLGKCKVKGKFTGFISDFVAFGDVNTALGFLSSDINLKTAATPEIYSGHINTKNFDIGAFTGAAPTIGKISINANIKGKGFRFQDLVSKVDGTISDFEFNGYNYQNITINGEVAKRMFEGALAIDDKNLNLKFNGSVDYTNPEPVFDCSAAIENMHITQLNFIKRDSSTSINANINMHLNGDDLDNALGSVLITDLKFKENENSFRVDSIYVNSSFQQSVKHFEITSDVLDAKVSGITRISSMVKSIEQVIVQYFPVNISNLSTCEKPENGNFSITIKDANELLYIIYPDLRIENNTLIQGQLNTYTNQLSLYLQSADVILYGVEFKELSIIGHSIDKQLGIKLKAGELLLNDSLTINDFIVQGISTRDSATVTVNASTLDSSEFVIDLGIKAWFANEQAYCNIAKQTLLVIHNKQWFFNPENKITLGNGVDFENFKMYVNQNEYLEMDGSIGGSSITNKLSLNFKNFDLDAMQTLFRTYQLELSGIANGTASFGTKNNKPDLTADLKIDNLRFFGDTLGDAVILSDFDTEKSRINVDVKITGATAKNVTIAGYYQLGKGKTSDELHFDCKLKRTSIAAFGPYLSGLVSNLKGMVSADLVLRGTPSKPILTGKGNLQKAGFTVNYLNTHYSLTDAFELKENSIDFNNITLSDAKGNTAKLNGKIKHHNLSDFVLDLQLLPTNFMILNTNEWQNDLFYGTAFASGKVNITGTFNNIDMKIALVSKKGTKVNLPLSTPEEVNESGFITFIKHDTIKASVSKNKSELLGMNIDMELSLNNDAEIKLIFDQKIGDIITGQGEGDLRIQVLNDGTFKLFGGYTINKGSYYFTMQNLIGKYFELVKGGTIKWIGDPYDGTIDLQARYTKNVGLYDLLQDTSGQYKRKVPVEVILSLKNNLFNPDIAFDIVVPDVDASTATLVQRYINTEEERNKQAMSVIVFNKFATPSVLEGTNTINSGSNVGASLSEFVTQQLSNWASQISSDFNIDFSYTPGDVVTSEQYDVAVSTKLMDDRIKLTGTVGYGNDETNSSNASNVVGDFLIEVDISKDGRFKLKGFNKSNNNTLLSTTTANYTQGIGWTYRQEFDKFGELFRRKEKKVETPATTETNQ